MSNYREIKKQLAKKEQKLEKANTQTKVLDNTSKDIDKILGSLKPTKLKKIIWLFQAKMSRKSKIIQKM